MLLNTSECLHSTDLWHLNITVGLLPAETTILPSSIHKSSFFTPSGTIGELGAASCESPSSILGRFSGLPLDMGDGYGWA